MTWNPELRRHVWVELTPHRLIAIPSLLSVVLLFVYLLCRVNHDVETGSAIARAAMMFFCALVYVWGCGLAAGAIVNEFSGRTWDSQRMTSLSAGSMTWGKLLGGPICAWYGGGWCLAVFLAASPLPLAERLADAGCLVLGGVLLHAFTLLACLHTIRKTRRPPVENQGGYALLGILAMTPILVMAMQDPEKTTWVWWFSVEASPPRVALFSLAAFAAWAVTGFHRLVRAELQLRNGPLVWLGFVAFLIVYVAGFVGDGNAEVQDVRLPAWRLTIAYGIATFFVYVMAFSEAKSPMAFQRLLFYLRSGDRERLLDELPRWLVTLPLAGGLCAVAIAVGPAGLERDLLFGCDARALLAVSFLFVLRDLALLLALNFSANPRRADAAALVYLFVLYAVVPGICEVLGLSQVLGLFWPRPDATLPLALVLPGVGVALTVAFAGRRWRRLSVRWPRGPAIAAAATGPR